MRREACVRSWCSRRALQRQGTARAQEEIAKIASDGGIAMLGPESLWLHELCRRSEYRICERAAGAEAQAIPASRRSPLIPQSGGFMAHLRQAFDGRNLQTSYTVSPGNEGGLDLVDFVEFLTTG